MKRSLFLVHRWLGILLCMFMALWFLSGVVMMYVGYPKLTLQERLGSLPTLDSAVCCVSVREALKALPADSALRGLRLTSIAGLPTYVFALDKNRFVAVDGQSGKLIEGVDAVMATASANAFMPGKAVYLELVAEDAWTHSRALDGHRPLHVVEVQGASPTLLYVSSMTGEVVRDASLTERGWGWSGAWLHWLYPLRGGWVDAWWSEIVIYTSLLATLLGISGIWTGCLRWRRQLYANGSHSPYRSLWARWHHKLGLVFVLLLVTWIVSGLFSMNPWKLFDSGAERPARSSLFLPQEGMATDELLNCLKDNGFAASELEWTRLADSAFILARNAEGGSRLLQATACSPFLRHEQAALEAAGASLLPAARIADAVVQESYDWHYYARAQHTMGGHLDRPLPVLRLAFDDEAETWLYLDPRSGAVVLRLDGHARVKRWLFALLHSWDWLPLLALRPLWDILMVLGSIGGLAISLSGAVIGWRRMTRKSGQPAAQKTSHLGG